MWYLLLIVSYWFFNPLGPRTTKVVNASRVMRGLEPLLTLLSPPRTPPKLRHFRSTFIASYSILQVQGIMRLRFIACRTGLSLWVNGFVAVAKLVCLCGQTRLPTCSNAAHM